VRLSDSDRNSAELRRSSSLPSPRRRRPVDSAHKENVRIAATPTSPPTVAVITRPKTPGPATRGFSLAAVADTSRMNSRDSVSLKRRSSSMTVKDRAWHRELVHQYGIGGAA